MRLRCKVECHLHIAVVKRRELQQLQRLVRCIGRKGLGQGQTLVERQMLLLKEGSKHHRSRQIVFGLSGKMISSREKFQINQSRKKVG